MSSFIKIVKQSVDFLGYSNLFLASTVFFSTIQNGLLFPEIVIPSLKFGWINFVAAFFLYNLQRIYQSTYPTTDTRLLWYRINRKWIFTIAVLLIFLFHENLWQIFNAYKQGMFVYFIMGFASLLYFLPPLSLRKIKYSKQFFIAFCWTVVCNFIPVLFHRNSFSGIRSISIDEWNYLISQFLFISALCIPFDIRDYKKDKAESTLSLPVVLGITKSKKIAIVLLLIFWILSFFLNQGSVFLSRSIISILSIAVVYFSNENRNRYYFIFITDGLILLQSILIYFL